MTKYNECYYWRFVRKFIKLERDNRLKNIQNKSCFKNPYLNWGIQLVNNQAQKNCNGNYSQNQ